MTGIDSPPIDVAEANAAASPLLSNGEVTLAEQVERNETQEDVSKKLETCRSEVVSKLLNKLQLGVGIKPFIENIFNKFCSSKNGLDGLTESSGAIDQKAIIDAVMQTSEWQGILALADTDDEFLNELATVNISIQSKLQFIKENKDTSKSELLPALQKFLKGKKTETLQINDKLDIKSKMSQIFMSYKKLFTPGFNFETVKRTIKSDLRTQINKLRQEEKGRRSKVELAKKSETKKTTVQEVVESTTKEPQSNPMFSSLQNIANNFSMSGTPKESDKFDVAFDLNISEVAGKIESKMDVDQYFDQMVISAEKKVDQYMDKYIKGRDLTALNSSLTLDKSEKSDYLKTIPKWAIDGDLATDYVKYITEKDDKGNPKNPHKTFNQYLRENLEISGFGLMLMQLMSMLNDLLPQLKGEGKKRKEELSTARTKLEELIGIKPKEVSNKAQEGNDTAKAYSELLTNNNWNKVNISDLYSTSDDEKVVDNRKDTLSSNSVGMGKMTEILNAKDDSVLGVARTKGLKWETIQKVYENQDKFENKEGIFKFNEKDVEWTDKYILKLLKKSEKSSSTTKKMEAGSEKDVDMKEAKKLIKKYKTLSHIDKLVEVGIPDKTLYKIQKVLATNSFFNNTLSIGELGIVVDPDGLNNKAKFNYRDIKSNNSDFIKMIDKVYEEEVGVVKKEFPQLKSKKTAVKKEVLTSKEAVTVGIKLTDLTLLGSNPYEKYSSKSQFKKEANRINDSGTEIKGNRSILQQKLATAYMNRYGDEMKGKSPFERLEELDRLTGLFYKGHAIDPAAKNALIDTYGLRVTGSNNMSKKSLDKALAKMPEDVIIENFNYNSRGTNIIMAKLFPSTII